jgi:hypothetical protein
LIEEQEVRRFYNNNKCLLPAGAEWPPWIGGQSQVVKKNHDYRIELK